MHMEGDNCGRNVNQQMVQGLYLLSMLRTCYVLIPLVLTSAVTTLTILSYTSWKCASHLVSNQVTAHQTECRIREIVIAQMQQEGNPTRPFAGLQQHQAQETGAFGKILVLFCCRAPQVEPT